MRFTFKSLTEGQRLKFKRDCVNHTAVEMADVWEISRDTAYLWAYYLGVQVKKPEYKKRERITANPITRYKGFEIKRISGKMGRCYQVTGSVVQSERIETLYKFIDTYIQRTQKQNQS